MRNQSNDRANKNFTHAWGNLEMKHFVVRLVGFQRFTLHSGQIVEEKRKEMGLPVASDSFRCKVCELHRIESCASLHCIHVAMKLSAHLNISTLET